MRLFWTYRETLQHWPSVRSLNHPPAGRQPNARRSGQHTLSNTADNAASHGTRYIPTAAEHKRLETASSESAWSNAARCLPLSPPARSTGGVNPHLPGLKRRSCRTTLSTFFEETQDHNLLHTQSTCPASDASSTRSRTSRTRHNLGPQPRRRTCA